MCLYNASYVAHTIESGYIIVLGPAAAFIWVRLGFMAGGSANSAALFRYALVVSSEIRAPARCKLAIN